MHASTRRMIPGMKKTPPGTQQGKSKLRKSLKLIQKLSRQNRLREARPLCDNLYAQGLREAPFLHVYGLALREAGELENALAKTFAAHELDPADAKILNSLGIIFEDMGELETAIAMFKRATSTDKQYGLAWENLGNALRNAGRFSAAELALICAHHADKSRIEPLFNLALVQTDMRRYARAAEIMDDLLQTHHSQLKSNKRLMAGLRLRRLQVAMQLEDLDYVKEARGAIERDLLNDEEEIAFDRTLAQYHEVLDQLDQTIAILEAAVARQATPNPDLNANLGYCYGVAGRLEDGLATLKTQLSQQPDHAATRYNLALVQFKAGEIAQGFDNYETRWQFRAFPSKRRTFDAPLWTGEAAGGKRILVWREQGIGDEVRYASLIPELHDRGATITFECTEKLIPLWKASFPWAEIKPEGEALCTNDPDYAGYDYQIPVGSLGRIFRRSLQDFREKQQPWIARNPDAENAVRAQLAVQPDELLVGICWRSMNQVASRDKVFMNCNQLTALNGLPNVRWLNLQYSSTEEEIETIRNAGIDLYHFTDLDQKDDLTGACNLIGACDLVISVGGSVGDLTGGVGTPMIYMTRELSEAYLGTDHVPWFVNCKSYPVAAYKSDETLARIVGDWPEISHWAASLKSEDRRAADAAHAGSAHLDLTYHFAAGKAA